MRASSQIYHPPTVYPFFITH